MLFNPKTKRYIVRRTFKVISPKIPIPYSEPVEFEAIDQFVDDAETEEDFDSYSSNKSSTETPAAELKKTSTQIDLVTSSSPRTQDTYSEHELLNSTDKILCTQLYNL